MYIEDWTIIISIFKRDDVHFEIGNELKKRLQERDVKGIRKEKIEKGNRKRKASKTNNIDTHKTCLVPNEIKA